MKLFSERFRFMQPLAYMVKDVIDTFKPYKSSFYVQRDLWAPVDSLTFVFNGLKNKIAYGIGELARGRFSAGFGHIAHGGTEILRGLTRFVATPFIWFLRMPLRGLITFFTGFQKAEDGNGIQREISKGHVVFTNIGTLKLALEEQKRRKELVENYEKVQKAPKTLMDLLAYQKAASFCPNEEGIAQINREAASLQQGIEQGINNILNEAEDISKTIQRKYKKALDRGQKTDLNFNSLPSFQIERTQLNGGIEHIDLKSFNDGLRFFDTNKHPLTSLLYTLDQNNLTIDRPIPSM